MVEGLKSIFLKFISGRLGLAITFWLYGVLVALTLDFLTSQTAALWQITVLAVAEFIHFVLIIPAVWNASKLYQGKSIWKWLARILALLNVAKWLWYLPLLVATISAAYGFSMHSSDYWELNTQKLVCQPAEYLRTPEMLTRKYQCKSSVSADNKLIMTRCWQGNQAGDFLFARNVQDCQKYLTKLKTYKREHAK